MRNARGGLAWAQTKLMLGAAFVAGVIVVVNTYMVLATGWLIGGSLLAISLTMLLKRMRNAKRIHDINLIQTAGSGAGTAAFVVMVMFAMKFASEEFQLSWFDMMALMLGPCLLGVFFAIPLRKSMVVHSDAPWPTAQASATLLRSLPDLVAGERDEETKKLASRLQGLFTWGSLSFVATILNKVHPFKVLSDGSALVKNFSVGKTGMGLLMEPLYFGVGFIVGPRIGLSLMFGAVVALLTVTKWGAAAGKYNLWAAITLMVAAGLADMVTRFVLALTQQNKQKKEEGIRSDESTPMWRKHWMVYVPGLLLTAGLTVVYFWWRFEVSPLVSVVFIGVGWVMAAVSTRVVGDTDINPIPVISKLIIALAALLLIRDPVALLLVALIGSAGAALSADTMGDFKVGHMIGTRVIEQIRFQVFGIVVATLVVVPVVLMLDFVFGISPEGGLTAPSAQIWVLFALAVSGAEVFTPSLLSVMGGAALLGIVLAVLGVLPWRGRKYVPSSMGIGLAAVFGFSMAASICLGSLARLVTQWKAPKWDEEHALLRGAGVLIGGSFAAVVAALLVVLGLLVAAG